MNLTTIDWIIMLVYFIFVLGIGFALKRHMKTSTDFFLSGRSIPRMDYGAGFHLGQPRRAGSDRNQHQFVVGICDARIRGRHAAAWPTRYVGAQ
jgi:hypothetical protein